MGFAGHWKILYLIQSSVRLVKLGLLLTYQLFIQTHGRRHQARFICGVSKSTVSIRFVPALNLACFDHRPIEHITSQWSVPLQQFSFSSLMLFLANPVERNDHRLSAAALWTRAWLVLTFIAVAFLMQ